MTEQTPPTGEPTATPAEGVGDGADEGAPPPPPPVDHTAVGEVPPPPPPPAKSRKTLIVAIVAAVLVLAMIGGVTAFLVTRGPDEHSITITSKAGGMERDTATEAKEKAGLSATRKQFGALGENVTYVKSGVYTQDDSDRGPKGPVVFVGAKVKSSEKNAGNFVDKIREQAKGNGFKVSTIPAGDGGGMAFCATPAQGAATTTLCGWATNDTLAYVVPIPKPGAPAGYESKQLAKIMLDLRSDVETSD